MSVFSKFTNEEETFNNRQFKNKEYLDKLFKYMREKIIDDIRIDNLMNLPRPEKRKVIINMIEDIIVADRLIISRNDKTRLVSVILDETLGYGPLEELLKDENITEIMVNGPEEIYIEKDGNVSLCPTTFKNAEHIRHIIERIIAPIGRRIDESSPMVDGRLPDGSRINAVFPPVSVRGPVMSIRKFNKEPLVMENLIDFGSLNAGMAAFIEAAVRARLNIIISGGTGSGKTTLLNILATAIPVKERIVTIEDMSELRLNRTNVVGLEARPPNVEGCGEITIRQLVRNALRMRPDRIIVGEVRGNEAIDMLQAMNTGHAGSLTTIHANSTVDALTRLEAMVVMNNPSLSVEVVRSYVIGALDLVIQIERSGDGTRKVTAISEVYKSSGGIGLQDIFNYKLTGTKPDGNIEGHFTATGIIPGSVQKFKSCGIELSDHIFQIKG